jgi:hypothetical protein
MKLVKEIKSKEGVVHFKRWQILKTPWFNVYIHGIYKADEDKHLHNHPWKYWGMVLMGRYIELSNIGERVLRPFMTYSAPTFRFHKIYQLKTKRVFTLFITKNENKEWGYLVNGKFVIHTEYRKLKREGKI